MVQAWDSIGQVSSVRPRYEGVELIHERGGTETREGCLPARSALE